MDRTLPKVIIYGINHQAQQLKCFLEFEQQAEVCAFVVDAAYKKGDELLGLPVYEFENVEQIFSPKEYQILLSFGYRNMVKNREDKYFLCKEKGYQLFTYISKDAIVYSVEIGEGSLIYPRCFLEPFTKIGKGVFVDAGVFIGHNTVVEDFCFFAPNATVCGDIHIESNCFLGANCTVANQGVVRSRTLVAAGAVLTKEVDEGTICLAAKAITTHQFFPEDFI